MSEPTCNDSPTGISNESKLLSLPEDVLSTVLSFASPADLGLLDLACTFLRAQTPPHWTDRARNRFGLLAPGRTGREAYRRGAAIIRGDAVYVPFQDYHCAGSICGTLVQGGATPSRSSRLVVLGGDIHDHIPESAPNGAGQFPIVVREGRGDFRAVRCIDGQDSAWAVAIVGHERKEVVISANGRGHLNACRARDGHKLLTQSIDDLSSGIGLPNAAYSNDQVENGSYHISLLGCEDMLIVGRRGHFYVFITHTDSELIFSRAVPVDKSNLNCSSADLAWASPEVGEHAFACSTDPGRICVWNALLTGGTTPIVDFVKLMDIQTGGNEYFYAIAVSERYVAVSSGTSKMISIYDQQGIRLHQLIEGEDVEQYMDGEDGFSHPISMYSLGEILVSTSILGPALCIWDMCSGLLLKRLEDAFKTEGNPNSLNGLPESNDVTSLVPLEHGTAALFSVYGGGQYMFAFPSSSEERERFQAIASREVEATYEVLIKYDGEGGRQVT